MVKLSYVNSAHYKITMCIFEIEGVFTIYHSLLFNSLIYIYVPFINDNFVKYFIIQN